MKVRAPKWSADPDRFERAAMRAVEADSRVWSGFVAEMLKQGTRPGARRISAKKAAEDAREALCIHFNNVWTSKLSRAFQRSYPELADYVETRGETVSLATVAA